MNEWKEPILICCACNKELNPGDGRFLMGNFAVCVECYDAGRRGPPPADRKA